MPLRTKLLIWFLGASLPAVLLVALSAPYLSRGALIGEAVGVCVLMASIGTVISRNVSTPIQDWTKIVRQVSGGDLSKRLYTVGDADLDELAFAFNKMTSDLKHSLEIFDRPPHLAEPGCSPRRTCSSNSRATSWPSRPSSSAAPSAATSPRRSLPRCWSRPRGSSWAAASGPSPS